jgi:hypothetical protein
MADPVRKVIREPVPKKSFGRKVAGALGNLTLCAAFAGAAGAGIHYYGTGDVVDAKIVSVDKVPGGDVVNTDQGVFFNTPTVMWKKSAEDTRAIEDQLKPGETVRLNYYGLHGGLPQEIRDKIPPGPVARAAGKTADDLGVHRNILDVSVIDDGKPAVVAAPVDDTPPPVAAAPTPVVEEAPPAPAPIPDRLPAAGPITPVSLVNPEGLDKEDPALPEVCIMNTDIDQINAQAPRLARDLDMMRQLPLTGHDVYASLKAQNSPIPLETCLFPEPQNPPSAGNYEDRWVRIGRGTGTSVTFHESFKATQDNNEGRFTMYSLNVRDAAVASMLKEATAVGYELAARQEAENLGFKFYEPLPANVVQGYTDASPAQNPVTQAVFRDAYNAALKQNPSADADTREALALQAGGRAVVSHLMSGGDPDWSRAYKAVTLKKIYGDPNGFQADDDRLGIYDGMREGVFRAQGQVSDRINLVPPEYLGPKAPQAVQKALDTFDLNPTPDPVAPVRKAPPGPGLAG